MKVFVLFSIFAIFGTAFAQDPVCPLKCPSCTKCDTKKGTCTLPRDFVTCTKGGASGVCFAGTCNAQLSLPTTTFSKCQTFRCPPTGICSLTTAPDGTDCTPANVAYESVCLKGVCNRIWLGVTDVMPYQNTGCIGKLNGVVCDTNHNLIDGETCQNGVCKFPDGTYYGYVPVPVPVAVP